MLYQILRHSHSVLRWIILLLLVYTFISAVIKRISAQKFSDTEKKASLMSMAALHIQLLLGLILYFISPKVVFAASSMSNRLIRFFMVEHVIIMLLAITLATVGYTQMKKASSDSLKRKRIIIFYGIALLLILLGIPWPGMGYSSHLF